MECGIDHWGRIFNRGRNPVRYLLGECAFTITICNSDDVIQLHTKKTHRGLQNYKIAKKYQPLSVHGRHQTVCKKNEKELQDLIPIIKIYNQDIGMEFGIKNCAIFIIKIL